ADLTQPADRLEAEGDALLEQLATATAAVNRDRLARAAYPRVAADVQRPLTELRDFSRKVTTEDAAAIARVRRWERELSFGTTLAAFIMATLVGFVGATAIRRAAARLSDHVSDVEQGKVRWRLSSAPGDDLAPVVNAFNEMAATVENAARKAEEDAAQA